MQMELFFALALHNGRPLYLALALSQNLRFWSEKASIKTV